MKNVDLKVLTAAFLVANLAGKFLWWVLSKVYHAALLV
jgi:hypothetical protein